MKKFKTYLLENYNNWIHSEPVKYAKHLEKTFGNPDEITNSQLSWFAKDGFKRIVIKDEYILHASPAAHYDFIYCYIDLKVPEKHARALAESSGSIMIDYLKGEVGARCGSITANATTLNYVIDVVAERVVPSKKEYEKRILAMKAMFENGSKYTTDWWPDQSGDADPKNKYYAEGNDMMIESASDYLTEEEISALRENPQILDEIAPVIKGVAAAAPLIAKYGKKAYNAAKNLFKKKYKPGQTVDKNFDKNQKLSDYGPVGKKAKVTPPKVQESNGFKQHVMIDPKTGKSYKAKRAADHIRYKKMGFKHENEI